MLEQYLQIDSVLYTAQHSIAKYNVKSVGEKPWTPLDPQSRTILENVCSIKWNLNDTTVLLIKGNKPKMHNLEPFTARLIAKVDKMKISDKLKPVAYILRDDFLNRGSRFSSSHLLFEPCAQTKCFLHAMLRNVSLNCIS